MASHKCAFCGERFTLNKNTFYDVGYFFDMQSMISMNQVRVDSISIHPGQASRKSEPDVVFSFFTCPNELCNKTSIYVAGLSKNVNHINHWINPDSTAIQYPDYVPASIRTDYEEACKIVDLSPKASATLSRRALQSMIRDFWGIKDKETLHQEINAIEDKISSDEYLALMGLKSIGNIGAHGLKDIDVILDIETHEADQLIKLIELFIDEWYIKRENKKLRLAEVKEIAKLKKSAENKSNL